jgi:hypothetical protein
LHDLPENGVLEQCRESKIVIAGNQDLRTNVYSSGHKIHLPEELRHKERCEDVSLWNREMGAGKGEQDDEDRSAEIRTVSPRGKRSREP